MSYVSKNKKCFSMQSILYNVIWEYKGTEKDSLKCLILLYIHTHIGKIGISQDLFLDQYARLPNEIEDWCCDSWNTHGK